MKLASECALRDPKKVKPAHFLFVAFSEDGRKALYFVPTKELPIASMVGFGQLICERGARVLAKNSTAIAEEWIKDPAWRTPPKAVKQQILIAHFMAKQKKWEASYAK